MSRVIARRPTNPPRAARAGTAAASRRPREPPVGLARAVEERAAVGIEPAARALQPDELELQRSGPAAQHPLRKRHKIGPMFGGDVLVYRLSAHLLQDRKS